MANDILLNAGSGGKQVATVDLANFASFGYPSGADTNLPQLPVCALYVSQAIGTVPTPVTTSNTLPVTVVGAIPAGASTIGNVGLVAGSAAIGKVSTNADGPVAAGAAPANSFTISGVFNTTAPAPSAGQAIALQVDDAGNLLSSNEGREATYSASSESFAIAAAPTDIAQLAGSASKTVKILKVSVQIYDSAAQTQVFPILAIKRSTAGSGFSSTGTAVPHNSNNAGATATMSFTTANPTTGGKVGSVDGVYLPSIAKPPTSGATAGVNRFEFRPVDDGGQPLTLIGTAQTLAINLGGITLTNAPTAIVTYTWKEVAETT
jgi:hypothetical protein